MRGLVLKCVVAGFAICVGVPAQAFQFSTLSHGTFTYSPWQDVESIDFYYYNGIAPIPVTNLFLDGATATGYIAGPGNVDHMDFSYTADGSETLGSQLNQDAHWHYTGGTGQFANLSGMGSFSIDFSFTDQNTALTTTGFTGQLNPVPEPASLAALGLGALALLRRRRTSLRQ